MKPSLFKISLICNLFFLFVSGYVLCSRYLLQTESPTHDWLYQTRASLFRKHVIRDNDIVFLGASIIQHCEWSELFENCRIKNRGIAGDTTFDVIDRLESILKGQPQKVFLMVGLNDLLTETPIASILANYETIIIKLKSDSPNSKFYIMSILPVSMNENNINDRITRLNKKTRDVCLKNDCTFVDLHFLFQSTDGRLNPKLTTDGIHLNADGYFLLKNAVGDFIN